MVPSERPRGCEVALASNSLTALASCWSRSFTSFSLIARSVAA